MGDVGKVAKIAKDNFEVKNGRNCFAKGNNIGRMKKRGYVLEDLTKIAIQYDKAHPDESILKHYIKQLMEDNRLLENFINKYVPTKTINELTGVDGSPLTFIVEKSYNNDKPKEEDTEKKQE